MQNSVRAVVCISQFFHASTSSPQRTYSNCDMFSMVDSDSHNSHLLLSQKNYKQSDKRTLSVFEHGKIPRLMLT